MPLAKCKCDYLFQDRRHGDGIRVHIVREEGSTNESWKCTVCESIKNKGDVKRK